MKHNTSKYQIITLITKDAPRVNSQPQEVNVSAL